MSGSDWQCYRRLADYRGGPDPADPSQVLAMQMVLRIERSSPPPRDALLVAAARATALLCLDERADTGGEWAPALDAWCAARIRKIARRARGAHWTAAQELPGLTVTEGDAMARALLPGAVGEVDKRISRLQIGGTDLPGESTTTVTRAETEMTLWLNPALEMTVGKQAAQLGHGAMLGVPLLRAEQARGWRDAGAPLRVGHADERRWRELLDAVAAGRAAAVRDAGYTEIAPGSVTVVAEVP